MVRVTTESPISYYLKPIISGFEEQKKNIEGDKEKKGELKTLNNNIKSVKKIAACVNRSSSKCILFMLAYRVWNTFKACFGLSDRQQARKAINNLKDDLFENVDVLKEDKFALLNKVVTKSEWNKVGDILLETLIALNKNKIVQGYTDYVQLEEMKARFSSEENSKLSESKIKQRDEKLANEMTKLLHKFENGEAFVNLKNAMESEGSGSSAEFHQAAAGALGEEISKAIAENIFGSKPSDA